MIIKSKHKHEGQYGPYYIVNLEDGASCIVAEKKVVDVDAVLLQAFVQSGTTVKFSDGHKEIINKTDVLPPKQTTPVVDSSLLPVLERIANALETLAQNSVYNQME